MRNDSKTKNHSKQLANSSSAKRKQVEIWYSDLPLRELSHRNLVRENHRIREREKERLKEALQQRGILGVREERIVNQMGYKSETRRSGPGFCIFGLT